MILDQILLLHLPLQHVILVVVVDVVVAVIIEDNILVYSINHYILYLCYLHPNINVFVIIFRNVSPSLSSCGQCSYKCVKLSVLYK